ncbi:hypothetical protein LIER_30718 [Lithospermum erythrorhizon]|uniref:alpha,alpha-trehalose-phosphate synthase (UDP-forming) n=1 Tax=Lithospermum erythrorhizon TaxID=34254 RepID=A0AAV3RP77_LITER
MMNDPGIFSEFNGVDDVRNIKNGAKRFILVANHLPLKGSFNEDTKKWCFEWDQDALILQLKDGLPYDVEVFYIGCLNVSIDDPFEQDEVAQLLLDKFKCVPTFLSIELINTYYHGFCKHYLWPLFHHLLPLTPNYGVKFDKCMWQGYVHANKVFADKIMEVINPDEDYVWVHDYHLMVLPTLLRRRSHRIKLGFFLHSPFPSSEIYRTLPVREEIMRGLLNCDLVGFQTFDYARHFLSCCSRMLGLDYQSKRGYIGLDYYGRTVNIKILPVGVHMPQLQTVMSSSLTAQKIQALKKMYEGRTVILGVDDVDMFKGVSLKFIAMRQLLDQDPSLRGNVVFVQIMNPARSRGTDIQDVQDEIVRVKNEINHQYGMPGYMPIVCINGPVSTQEKVAYYAIAECVVVNAVRDGMNLVPYRYIVSRQGNADMDKALGLDQSSVLRKSMIVVSEFIGCSPSLSGAIRVNPWNIESVSTAISLAVNMPDAEKELRHEKHLKYVTSHDISYWAKSFYQDLERACSDHHYKRFWGTGFALNFRVVALDPTFKKLFVERLAVAYSQSKSRLILLDYDGTMLPEDRVDKSPNSGVLDLLNGLCSDPNNVVFIVSGRGKESLGKWFHPCTKLGLSAEHGFFTRWNNDSPWETSMSPVDMDWKKMVLPVMEHYKAATDGSHIEQKESAIVWHHQDSDPDFGAWQAKELLDHLEGVLANEPVVVKRGRHIVEVKPQGVSKGTVVEKLLATMQSRGTPPDFVLCIGDDRSDEDMFESIATAKADPAFSTMTKVFACTVGQKPSMAKYYLDDTNEVISMLHDLEQRSPQKFLKSSDHETPAVEFS